MKKILSALAFAICILAVNFCSANFQTESNFDLNKDFNEKFQHVSSIYSGYVVGVQTYLSIRERPTVNSREIMRIPNGAELYLRESLNNDWWEVLSVSFNGKTYSNHSDFTFGIGWVSGKYVKITAGEGIR